MNSFGYICSLTASRHICLKSKVFFFLYLMDQFQARNISIVMFSREDIVQGVVFIDLQCPGTSHWDSELMSYYLFKTYQ